MLNQHTTTTGKVTTMSAFIVGTDHIDFLVSAACRYEITYYSGRSKSANPIDWKRVRVDHANADEIGSMLMGENLASISHLAYAPEIAQAMLQRQQAAIAGYRMRSVAIGVPGQTAALDVLKAAACLRYQSCEHPGWEGSDAEQFLAVLEARAINLLPGYSSAQWEWSRERARANAS